MSRVFRIMEKWDELGWFKTDPGNEKLLVVIPLILPVIPYINHTTVDFTINRIMKTIFSKRGENNT